MTRHLRRHPARPTLGAAAFLAVVTILLTGCSSWSPSQWGEPREPYVLVFEATGTATVRTATYVVDGRETRETSLPLPWRKSFSLPSDGREHEWSLVIEHHDGTVAVVVTVDGQIVTQGGGGGDGEGRASYSGSVGG